MRFLKKEETPQIGQLTRKQNKTRKLLAKLDKISKLSTGPRTILRKAKDNKK